MSEGRLLPLLLVLAALASAGFATLPRVLDRGREASPAEAVTPVFSVRRIPELTTRLLANERLATELEALLADERWAGTRSCLTVLDPDGNLVVSHGAGEALIPASTIKLLAVSTALERMGADATFTTRAVGDIGGDGAVGDLWLVGGGDPLLATAEFAEVAGWAEPPRSYTPLERVADRIVEAGVRSIGRLWGDESRYDRQRYLPSWNPTYATNPEVGPQSALTVNEGFVQWRPRAVAAEEPAAYAAGLLSLLLEERGVPVGAVGVARAGDGAGTLAEVASPPLPEVARLVLQDSDNLAAELLLKELGFRFGDGGTTVAGTQVVVEHLESLGVDAAMFTGIDGSGLDRGNRLSCEVLAAVLSRNGADGVLASYLPEAGRSGTLARRFEGTEAEGDVRAKTGSLRAVVGLAGWTAGHDGRRLQFALLTNDLPVDGLGYVLQQEVVVALAAHPRAPAPAEVGPLPPTMDGGNP